MNAKRELLCRRRTPAFGQPPDAGGRLRLQHLLLGLFARRLLFGPRLAVDQHADLGAVEYFALQHTLGDADQRLAVDRQDFLGAIVTTLHDLANLLIDSDRGLLGEIAMLRDLAAQKDLLFLLAEGQRAEFAHAPFANHLASEV